MIERYKVVNLLRRYNATIANIEHFITVYGDKEEYEMIEILGLINNLK